MEENKAKQIKELYANGSFDEALNELLSEETVDIADYLLGLDIKTAVALFRSLPEEIEGDVFACLGEDMQEKISARMTNEESESINKLLDEDTVESDTTGDAEESEGNSQDDRHEFYDELSCLIKDGKFLQLRKLLMDMNEADIAEFIVTLDDEECVVAFRILPKDISADVFAYLDTDIQLKIATAMTDKELYRLIDELYIDDTVDFLEEVPANVVSRVLSLAGKERRNTLNRFLNYPDNSAGSIMTNELVALHTKISVEKAIETVRKIGVDKETIYQCYCIDKSRHLVGTVGLNDLLFNENDVLIEDIMDSDKQLVYVKTTDDQEVVAEIAKHYDLLSVPVVDSEGRLVGIVTIDDIVDIIEDENTEDFERMASLVPSDDTYLKTSVFKLTKNRIFWLLILMLSATFTGVIIERFEAQLALIAGLTACIPMLMNTGGNAGNQTSTLIVRGLALGEIKVKDYYIVVLKELRVSIICGIILAAANFGRMAVMGLIDGTFSTERIPMYCVVCIAMLVGVIVSKLIGCTLPILAKLVKLDPALMAGPMITTIVDAITLLVYFKIADIILF